MKVKIDLRDPEEDMDCIMSHEFIFTWRIEDEQRLSGYGRMIDIMNLI